ncbi:hypothetical protein Acr_00g0018660 [Actinidia rufa]|uniref:Uncharacterized protein n=1 Tax=Actinidia rufa TaxID=165716 RepID=A0A7J0DBI3_9ERIC|nr:hypothetical protein Acr_00g0018660 [Actinidia rufa]
MADFKDAHVIEIPVDEEHQQKINTFSAIQHQPLMEISQSPGHLLFLKFWQTEEDLFACQISAKEPQSTTLFLAILFSSSFAGTGRCGGSGRERARGEQGLDEVYSGVDDEGCEFRFVQGASDWEKNEEFECGD